MTEAVQYEKLSTYAKRMGLHYRTVWNWFKDGKIEGAKMVNGAILVPVKFQPETGPATRRVAVYARVSSSENKSNLAAQCRRVANFAEASGYQVVREVCEVGSGVNDARPKLRALFDDPEWDVLVVEHKDRLTRFGFNYLDMLARAQGREIVVVNTTEDHEEDLMTDLVFIITSFCARLYGQRRAKRRTERILAELNND